MKTKLIVIIAVIVLAAWSLGESARAQEAVNENTVHGVLKTVYPDLQSEDIDIKMIKRLISRTKVNLEIEGKNAILYLKWQRYRNNYRWWFERDAEQSLIFLSKTTTFARDVNVHTREPESPAAAGKEEEVRVAEKTAEPEAEPDEQKIPEEEKAGEAEGAEQSAAVKAEPAEEPQTAQPEKEAGQPETEKVAEPAVSPETGDEPLKTEDRAQPDMSEPAEPAAAEPEMTELPEEATLILPVEIAVGPEAEVSEFLTTLVVVIGRGEDESYEKFLLRQDEMTGNVEDDDYRGAVNRWKEQFEAVHQKLSKADRAEIRKINLDRPQTYQIERATIQELSQKIVSVRQVYTGARVNMLLDGKEAYIKVGGLIRTNGGWRIGGLVEFIEPLAMR